MNKIHPDSKVIFILGANIFLLCIAAVGGVIFYRDLPPFIPLYNQLSWGISRLAPKEFLAIPIAIALGIGITNYILSRALYNNMPIVSRILIVTSLLVSLLMFFLIVRTIQAII